LTATAARTRGIAGTGSGGVYGTLVYSVFEDEVIALGDSNLSTEVSYLNDITGFHVKKEHVFQALDAAKGGPVAEGSVGDGTGMNCYEFKAGAHHIGEVELYRSSHVTQRVRLKVNTPSPTMARLASSTLLATDNAAGLAVE
jgi:L-aminopeptidase/D-esterase-like protein